MSLSTYELLCRLTCNMTERAKNESVILNFAVRIKDQVLFVLLNGWAAQCYVVEDAYCLLSIHSP